MIQSMTAFARVQNQGDFGSLVCEMRSINHRYLEISLHLPDMLRVMEMPIRERIRHQLKRGKIECTIRYQLSPKSADSLISLNTSLVKELCQASEKIASNLKNPAPVSATELLRYPGVIETKEADLSKLEEDLFQLIDKAILDLVAARNREGEELKQLFLERMEKMGIELAKVRERLPQVMTDARDRLIKRFSEASLDLDPTRLEQEMVMYAQRIDVAEEIERTETHITEIRRILKHGGLVGRRLDFLLQELNREANTLGSKSVDSVITHAAVEMKVLIEQVREQVQNVE